MDEKLTERLADAIKGEDPSAGASYEASAIAVVKALRDALVERRGDPRLYGQGFSDPDGALVAGLDRLLAEK